MIVIRLQIYYITNPKATFCFVFSYAIDHALRTPRNISTAAAIISDLRSMPVAAPLCTIDTNISRAVPATA